MEKHLLVDGHNFLFRGYYGVPLEAKRRDGTQVNAVYGFFSLLRKILKEIKPRYLTIVFDTETAIGSKISIRPEYKANRPIDHGSIYDQLRIIKKCLDIQDICWEGNERIEADDVIGIYSSQSKMKNNSVYVASNDYDFLQLVSNKLTVVRGYHGKTEKFTKKSVLEKFGVSPSEYIDYLALKGDIGDNIKGVSGIGKMRAADLVSTYGTIESIFQSYNTLNNTYRRLLEYQKDTLIETRDFLRIKTRYKNMRLNIEKYLLVNRELPDKMGTFLDENWEYVKS